MPPRRTAAQRRRSKRIRLAVILTVFTAVIVLIVAGLFAAVSHFIGSGETGDDPLSPPATQTTEPQGPAVTATATVGSSGDILIHTPVLNAAKVSSGVYNFDPMLQYMTPFVSKLDYSVINLEFGIGRNESDYRQREMIFRVPDTLIDSVMKTGYDLGLCANNHVTNGSSLAFTEGTLTEKQMDHIGLRASKSDKRYLVKDVNGIKIGFVNYTYGAETNSSSLVNYFKTDKLDLFYADMQQQMADMKAEGAEAIVLFIHWGYEYRIKPASHQEEMAKKLCEMGVDVIVGGHPHKIQPLELITAENGNRTACLYSMGNFLSNQTIEAMYGGKASNSRNFQDGGKCDIPDVSNRYKDAKWDQHEENCNDNGHTEDGLLFEMTFKKYEDGKVFLSGVDVLPTWCYCKKGAGTNGYNKYTVVPLDKATADWQQAFAIAPEDVVYAERSYDRTMKLVGDGIEAINASCQAKIDAYVEEYKTTHKQ